MSRVFIQILILMALALPGFKTAQLKNSRVRDAYKEKQKDVLETLRKHNLEVSQLEIFIRVFKTDNILELWGRNRNGKFVLLKKYGICASSGISGPKREQGDSQVPEGFYVINTFNPNSNFYLSLGISYPNQSDRILGNAKNPGGDIFIHGNCVTIGCIPVTDDKIKELYIYAVEAGNNGQKNIPVHIFPTYMDNENLKKLKQQHSAENQLLSFWENLSAGYNYFEKSKELPKVSVQKDGMYVFK
jgi:murein L,D-transpeptidase YafK